MLNLQLCTKMCTDFADQLSDMAIDFPLGTLEGRVCTHSAMDM